MATTEQYESAAEFDIPYANRTLALFALLAASVMYIEMMLTPSLPRIASDYGVTSAQVSLILSLYTVFGTAVNPLVGKLGDLYGKKRILTYVLVLYVIMVASTSFAPNFPYLLASRTLQGVGLAIFPLAFSIAREEFPREMVPRAQGLISAMFGAGAAVGLPVGAYIANSFGWQANYHIGLVLVMVLTVLIIASVKESRYKNPGAQMDYVGAVLLGASLASIVLGLSEGSNWGWGSPAVLGLMLGGLALLFGLVPLETRMAEPILNLRLLSIRNVLVSNAAGFMTSLGMFLAFQSVIYKLELPAPAGFGYDILSAGLFMMPFAITMVVIAFPVGILISKVGTKPFLFVGGIIGAVGFAMMSTASTPAELTQGLIIASAGLGMSMVSLQNLLVLSVQPREMGLTTSMSTVFRNMGSSMGAPIAGSLISTYTTWTLFGYYNRLPMFYSLPSNVAFQYSFYIAVLAFCVISLFTLLAREVIGKHAQAQAI